MIKKGFIISWNTFPCFIYFYFKISLTFHMLPRRIEKRIFFLSRDPSFSIGFRNNFWNCFSLPKKPGKRTWKRDHNSPKLFSMGVPVRHSLWFARMSRMTLWACVLAFLIFCASSRIRKWNERFKKTSLSLAKRG